MGRAAAEGEGRPVVEIVSTNVANGVTYLLNVLLGLGLPIFAGGFDAFWRADRSGRLASNPLLRTKFSVWVPALAERTTLPPAREPAFEWTHEWPHPQASNRRRILVVRDPRDALFSYYKRFESEAGAGPARFLQVPVPPLGTRILEKWALQQVLWRETALEEALLVVRFEDLKGSPAEAVARILRFAGVERPPEAIEAAVEASRTERVKAHHDRVVGRGVPVIRKGRPFEWKEHPGREDLALYRSGYVLRGMRAFGYEVDPLPAAAEAEARLGKWLAEASRRVGARWARAIYGGEGAAPEAARREFEACARESWFAPAVLARHVALLPPGAGEREALEAHLLSLDPGALDGLGRTPPDRRVAVALARLLEPHLAHPFGGVRAATLRLLWGLGPRRVLRRASAEGGRGRLLAAAPLAILPSLAPHRRLFALRNRLSLALVSALTPARAAAGAVLPPLARWIDRRVLSVPLGRTG